MSQFCPFDSCRRLYQVLLTHNFMWDNLADGEYNRLFLVPFLPNQFVELSRPRSIHHPMSCFVDLFSFAGSEHTADLAKQVQ